MLSHDELERFTGKYRYVSGNQRNIGKDRKVMVSDSKLYYGKNSILKIQLLPVTPNRFVVKGLGDTLTFVSDENGNPTGIEGIKSDGVFTVLKKID